MRLSFRRPLAVVCLLSAFCLVAFAQQTLTVAKLVEAVKSSIQLKNQDKDVAGYLARVKMSERLSPVVVEELQAAGAGPRTVAALTLLVTQSASLSPAPPKMVITTPQATGPREPAEAEKKQ